MEKIEALSSNQQEMIDREVESWINSMRSTLRVDRALIAEQIDKIYMTVTKHSVRIIWCQSPWQLVAIAFLLLAFKRSNLTRSCRAWLRATLNKPHWIPVWQLYDEYRNELDEFLHLPLDRFFLNSQLTQELEESLTAPMRPGRWQIYEELLLRFNEESMTDFERRTFRFRRALWGSVLNPVETQTESQILQDFGRSGLLKLLETQIRAQYLSPEDQEKLTGIGKSREELKERLRRQKTRLSQYKLLPHLSSQDIYLLKVFLASNLQSEQHQVAGMLIWPWQDSIVLQATVGAKVLDPEFQKLIQEHQEEVSFWSAFQQRVLALMPAETICLVSDKPTYMEMDSRDLLHCATGPAMSFSDGSKYYRWHGVTVPPWIIEKPESITVEIIDNELNTEVRRVLIERYGESRYLADSGAVAVAEDEYGVLYRKSWGEDDEDLVMVKVINSTENPDGTRNVYFLRVPPESQTPKQAIAWTFGLEEEDYGPSKES